jgi:hypothetical protein
VRARPSVIPPQPAHTSVQDKRAPKGQQQATLRRRLEKRRRRCQILTSSAGQGQKKSAADQKKSTADQKKSAATIIKVAQNYRYPNLRLQYQQPRHVLEQQHLEFYTPAALQRAPGSDTAPELALQTGLEAPAAPSAQRHGFGLASGFGLGLGLGLGPAHPRQIAIGDRMDDSDGWAREGEFVSCAFLFFFSGGVASPFSGGHVAPTVK